MNKIYVTQDVLASDYGSGKNSEQKEINVGYCKTEIKYEKDSPILYSSKIIKAGALLSDTKTLFSHWDAGVSYQENIQNIRSQNLFGKASRARVNDILKIFRQRYLAEEQVTRTLATLVKRLFNPAALDKILYFHSAKADRLLYDVVTKILLPLRSNGLDDINPSEVYRTITKWVNEGKTSSLWGEYTVRRVSQGVLATLRDFGVLQGAVNKRIAPLYLPIEAFCYVAFYLKEHVSSGERLLNSDDWKLFFLFKDGVERFLMEAQQRGFLEYHAAGSVIRITFRATSLEEYVNVLA